MRERLYNSKSKKVDSIGKRKGNWFEIPFDAEFYEWYETINIDSKALFDFFEELKNKIESLQSFILEFKSNHSILSQTEKTEIDNNAKFIRFK